MYNGAGIRELKRIDPIWKRLRFDRIWKILFLAYMVIYVLYSAGSFWRVEGAFSIYAIFFLSFGVVVGVISQFRQESYWKRIGLRRLEALRDPQPFVASGHPWPEGNALTLPVTFRLRWNRVMLAVAGVLILIVICLPLVAILFASFHRSSVLSVLPFVGFLALILMFLAMLVYFLLLRFQPREIELTEDGIKTRYMGQERSLRWDEARIFAVYDAQGVKKSNFARTYELSNERTVVRWGEQMLANPFLVVESSVNKRQDFNWLVRQVNALVAARTDLPLLDLGDRQNGRQPALQRGGRPVAVREQAEEVSSQTLVRIAQFDPLLRRTELRGELAVSFGLLAALSVVAIVAGLIARLSNNTGHLPSVFSGGFANFLLILGVLLLALMLISLGIIRIGRGYWKRIGQMRPQALLQPERFKTRIQPAPFRELPQPASLRIHTRRILLVPLTFFEGFVLCFLFCAVFFGLAGNRLIITLIISLIGGLVVSMFLIPFVEKASERRIEVTPFGLSSRFGGADSQLGWQDARLFSVYRGLQLFKGVSRMQVYELASEQTVVRWLWPRSRFQLFTTEPRMSQAAFDSWIEHLHGYVETQTNLPLMELDSAQGQL